MKKPLTLALLLGAHTLLFAQQLYTTLDVLRPGKVVFPNEVQHLLVVNNSVVQPKDYGHTIRLSGEKAHKSEIATDSVALFCLAGLVEQLSEADFFSSVSLLEQSQNRGNLFFMEIRLSGAEVDSLCNHYQADAILALNRIAINDLITDYYLPETYQYLAALDVKIATHLSIHYPKRIRPENLQFIDSLFWEQYNYQRAEAINALPNREDAFVDAAIHIGKSIGTQLIPRWEEVDRYFYTNSNKLMKQGLDSLYHKAWNSAIALWEEGFATVKNAKTKAQFAANIAVAAEISGNINKAIAYAQQSIEYFSNSLSLSAYSNAIKQGQYLKELQVRKREIEFLDQQP